MDSFPLPPRVQSPPIKQPKQCGLLPASLTSLACKTFPEKEKKSVIFLTWPLLWREREREREPFPETNGQTRDIQCCGPAVPSAAVQDAENHVLWRLQTRRLPWALGPGLARSWTGRLGGGARDIQILPARRLTVFSSSHETTCLTTATISPRAPTVAACKTRFAPVRISSDPSPRLAPSTLLDLSHLLQVIPSPAGGGRDRAPPALRAGDFRLRPLGGAPRLGSISLPSLSPSPGARRHFLRRVEPSSSRGAGSPATRGPRTGNGQPLWQRSGCAGGSPATRALARRVPPGPLGEPAGRGAAGLADWPAALPACVPGARL